MIKEYKVINAWGTNDLNQQVNDHIKDGWQPFGPPCMTVSVPVASQQPQPGMNAAKVLLAQALVKEQ